MNKTISAAFLLFVWASNLMAAETTLISRNTLGEHPEPSSEPALSSDGKVVVFTASSDTLLPPGQDSNNRNDIVALDTELGTITLVSVSSTGVQSDGTSIKASVSANGRYVAFMSRSTTFTSAGTAGHFNIFVHDRNTGLTTLVSRNFAGVPGNGESESPSISDDGRFIAFHSSATDLVAGDTNDVADVFVFDRVNLTMQRVSVSSTGQQSNARSFFSAISGDGQVVAFLSSATNFWAFDNNELLDVYKHDLQSGNTIAVSSYSYTEILPGGIRLLVSEIGNGQAKAPAINVDGSIIAFATNADNLHGQTADAFDHVVVKKIH